MASYVLIHGAGADSWYWHLVTPHLESRGHEVVAPDLPSFDESKGLSDYVQIVVDAIGNTRHVIVVAQSLGAFIGASVCDRVSMNLLALLNAMVPAPGETAGAWWENTGQGQAFREQALADGRDPDAEFDPIELFLHDVPRSLWEESGKHAGPQAGRVFADPVPFEAWPRVPKRAIVSQGDRFFPPKFQRRLIRERLGIKPDEIKGGHLAALSQPADLVQLLERIRTEAVSGSN
jgi:pimeloyl-ACP methyl ester carboxylesterase